MSSASRGLAPHEGLDSLLVKISASSLSVRTCLRLMSLSAFWERGSLDLPACVLWRGSAVAQYDPSSSTNVQDPREGPSLARRTTQHLLGSGLTRLAREGQRDQGKANLARFW